MPRQVLRDRRAVANMQQFRGRGVHEGLIAWALIVRWERLALSIPSVSWRPVGKIFPFSKRDFFKKLIIEVLADTNILEDSLWQKTNCIIFWVGLFILTGTSFFLILYLLFQFDFKKSEQMISFWFFTSEVCHRI